MKILIHITVQDTESWDEHSVDREVSVMSDDSNVIKAAAAGLCSTLNATVQDAIYERMAIQNAKDQEDPTDDE